MKKIAFAFTKHGRKRAYRVTSEYRYILMSLAEAELLIATEQAREVPYIPFTRPDLWKKHKQLTEMEGVKQ